MAFLLLQSWVLLVFSVSLFAFCPLAALSTELFDGARAMMYRLS